jgi:PAS domain S-box-containing protein
MPVMIWVSNENDKVVYTNKTSRDFYGIDLRNLNSAEEFSHYVHPDYHHSAIKEWAEKISAKQPAEVQYLAKNKYGEYRWIYEIAIPRFLDNNKYLGYIGTGFDITSERRMFYKLEEEKKKYELLSNQSADIIFLVDDMGIVEYVSPSIKRILGFEENSMIGNSLFNMLNPLGELSINDFKQEDNKLSNRVLSFQVKDAQGDTKWVEAAYNTFKEENLGIEKIVIHLRDINDQYIAQNMLIENEAKYRNLFSNMNLGIMEVDTNEKILYVNSSFERISGYSQDELLGRIAPEIFITEISEKEISLQERRNREHGKEGLYELRIRKKDGKNATWVISGAPTYDLKGKVRGSIGIHWDVTEIRELESKILFESVQKEKELMEARLQAEEEQRDTIGRDLHDGVGQMLAYLSVYMNILKEKDNINPTDVEKAQTTIKKTIDEVRRLARNLAPPAIKDLGLRDAIVELIGSYAIIPKPAFNLKIYKGKDPSQLQYEHKIMLFRVLQELSSNTFKYAKAEKVDIKIDYNKSGLEMTYLDNGIGFDMSTIKKGIGLKSILSRVEFYGGILKINTKVNEGTEVIIKLPFE